ncbi:membrane protein [Streptococcus pseudoporcinus]|uniref:Membrane protein n=2 Tax=Streptococcus pseudoporcinus TaxID=361101 RepID=A0A4U9XKE8_9STRE|nr:membrane protein [Streptococcus pseudoporcinus]VUC65519.1 membrane protein [Streptococcus pseudoporcinus]VUC96440.1 membrane protein [Streptococcus pseudoporcinus]VUC96834.1 membrane protein [Streptococcus pseudoporcinus]
MMIVILVIVLNLIKVYSYLLLGYALLSWFPGAYDTWLGRFVCQLVEPILQPFLKLPLQFAGIDFTVFVVMIALNFLSNFLIRLLIG